MLFRSEARRECPNCHSKITVKNGLRDTNYGQNQRFLCKSCGRRFSEASSLSRSARALDGLSNIKKEELEKKLDEGAFKCIAVIDSPFIENLLQRMNSYLMRLGVRDLDKAEIRKLRDGVT